MSLGGEKSFKMRMRDMENAFKYRRIPYPKRSVELIAILAISCTFFLFMHTNKLNSRLKEMEVKLQPSEFSALGLTGNQINPRESSRRDNINTLHGTYQYLKSTGQLHSLKSKNVNNTQFAETNLLLFNRVPKVGSEQLIELIRRLSVRNGFGVSRAPFSEPVRQRLEEDEQEELANELLDFGEPYAYSMHVNYIDFRHFELPQPIYINMIRDPVERVISWFYYKRAPWTAVRMYKLTKQFRKPQWYKKGFEDCAMSGDLECRYEVDSKFQNSVVDHKRQTLFFCGHDPSCEPFNSNGALQLAMQHVENEYAVVGSWEDLNVTLEVFEHYIPRFFRGATQLYFDVENGMISTPMNVNPWKPTISAHIKELIRKNFTREYEFYNFCKQRLYKQYYALKNTT
ncbi:heparan sulfate 2-O-sulfotransferase pipe isoform X5 [Bactrocera oleae]|uniref:heparan sulfate 2-O-sulfotransferase pipe isoform X5 n=1 Tax=Bactrocera oleae TaxID=104688 RepID=UPI00387EA972